MQYANTPNGKTLPQPGLHGTCPQCDSEVISKCGEINTWHWAHKSLEDCDTWSEGETDWHLKWKSFFPPEYTEITMIKDGIKHRADVRLPNGRVIEFQNSPITPHEIQERNRFWGNVIWIFNLNQITPDVFKWAPGTSRHDPEDAQINIFRKERIDTFLWLRARRSLEGMKNFILDFGTTVFIVKEIYFDSSPARGWGYYKNKYVFLFDYLKVEDHWAKTGITKKFDWATLTW